MLAKNFKGKWAKNFKGQQKDYSAGKGKGPQNMKGQGKDYGHAKGKENNFPNVKGQGKTKGGKGGQPTSRDKSCFVCGGPHLARSCPQRVVNAIENDGLDVRSDITHSTRTSKSATTTTTATTAVAAVLPRCDEEPEDDTVYLFACFPQGVEDDKNKNHKEVEILIDSGAAMNVCSPNCFAGARKIPGAQEKSLRDVAGRPLKSFGVIAPEFSTHAGRRLHAEFQMTDAIRPVISVARAVDRGYTVVFSQKGAYMQNEAGHREDLIRKGGLFYLSVKQEKPGIKQERQGIKQDSVLVAPVAAEHGEADVVPDDGDGDWVDARSPPCTLR